MHFDLNDQYQHRSSAVHRLDPRVKVVTTFLYILVVGVTLEGVWWAFLVQYVLILLAGLMAKLGWFYTFRRSFIALPFVLAALALPFTMQGPELFRIPGLGWTVSNTGMIRFMTILFRSWLAVQAAVLLTAITRVPDLLWALSALRLPKPLVATISFMYRYLFLFADEALRMLRARASRSPKLPGNPKPSLVWQGKVAGSMVGTLFLRSLERSERVYAAMLSRGYDGQVRTMTRFRMTLFDWVALSFSVLLLSMVQILAHMG